MKTNELTKKEKLEEIETVFRKKNLEMQEEQIKRIPNQKILSIMYEELMDLQNQINTLKDELNIRH